MFDGHRRNIDVRPREADVGIAKEIARDAAERLVAIGWNAPVGGSAVVEIFVAKVDPRVRTDKQRGGRIDPIALERDMTAEAVAVFVEPVEPQADRAGQRLIDVGGEPPRTQLSPEAVSPRRR